MSEENKYDLTEAADVAGAAADLEAAAGISDTAAGLQELETAGIVADVSRDILASGASDITRGVDAKIVAERAAVLSEVVAEAGVTDVYEGAELLAASDDIAVQSALVGALSAEDLEVGMGLASIAGQLEAAGDVVDLLDMPILSIFLEEKGEELHAAAVDAILRAGATRALSAAMRATGADVGDLGANEVEEGLMRLAAAGGFAIRSEELSIAGDELIGEGLDEVMASEAIREDALDLAADGIVEIAMGAEELGEAAVMGDVADTLADAADEE